MSTAAFTITALTLIAVIVPMCLHTIDEGHVGVYWRGGALVNSTSSPGFRLKIPFLTTYEQVQVTVQTDKVTDIPCGTSGGVMISFDQIEVVNRLNHSAVLDIVRRYSHRYDRIWIFDKIHHEINQFCSQHTLQEVYIDLFDQLDEKLREALQRDCDKWAPGIEIIATRVTKPRIPPAIARNYELMEAEKTKLMIATQRSKVIEKEAETERIRAMIEAQKVADVSRINSEKQVLEKRASQTIQGIKDKTHVDRQKAEADAAYYRQKRSAEANTLKLTPQFLQNEFFNELQRQPKYFFVDSMSSIFGSVMLATSDGAKQSNSSPKP